MSPQFRYTPAVQEILRVYSGLLTVRQIFYRLVSMGTIPNRLSNYNCLCHALKVARIKGEILWDRIEDRSRPLTEGEDYGWLAPEDYFQMILDNYESAEDTFRDSHQLYSLPFWFKQPHYVEVWIEKDALSGVFRQVTDPFKVSLIVCRGYQSISNINDAVQRMASLLQEHNRDPVILYFGDFDPRGENIPEVIERDFDSLGFDVEINKVALTREQIDQLHLIPQPCKKSDVMADNWMAKEGDNVWELDAIEPKMLISIVKSAIDEYFDKTVFEERSRVLRGRQTQIKQMILEQLGESKEGTL